jgi:hypothetical protein
MLEKNDPNLLKLIGNPEENFFVLGQKDKTSFSEVYDQITLLVGRTKHASTIAKFAMELSNTLKDKEDREIIKLMKSYAEGLDRPFTDVYFAFVLPEFIASFNKWIPNLIGLIPGCSSLFTYNHETQSTNHIRILDYALSGPFEAHARTMLFDFKNRYKIFSFNSAGMPFPSLSAVNEKGLTLALHYRHGDYFDFKGHSIFGICYQVLSFCSSIKEAKKLIKEYQSMGHWGIYLSDASGEVSAIDIRGTDFYQQRYHLRDHTYLYFNNLPVLKDPNSELLQPFGHKAQCLMRHKVVQQRIQKLGQKNKTLEESFKLLTRLEPTDQQWYLSPSTLSSIQAVGFNYKENRALELSGESPKTIQSNHLYQWENLFDSPSVSESFNDYFQETSNFQHAYKKWAKAQSFFDLNQIEKAYHEIQMCISLFKGFPEADIAQFYFYVWQYIYLINEKELSYLYEGFRSLKGKLPSYLNDHRLLFIFRIEKLLNFPLEEFEDKIKHPQLKSLYLKEKNLSAMSIKLMRKLIYPRMEILDIIYLFSQYK